MKNYLPLDDQRTLSVAQFCEIEGLSPEEYEVLWARGLGPVEFCLDRDVSVIRITPEERRAWHTKIRNKEAVRKLADQGPVSLRYEDSELAPWPTA